MLCGSAFPLVPVLGSTHSATGCPALFVGFTATMTEVELLGIVRHRLRLLTFPMRACGVHPQVNPEVSRFPYKERPHMPGSLTTPG